MAFDWQAYALKTLEAVVDLDRESERLRDALRKTQGLLIKHHDVRYFAREHWGSGACPTCAENQGQKQFDANDELLR